MRRGRPSPRIQNLPRVTDAPRPFHRVARQEPPASPIKQGAGILGLVENPPHDRVGHGTLGGDELRPLGGVVRDACEPAEHIGEVHAVIEPLRSLVLLDPPDYLGRRRGVWVLVSLDHALQRDQKAPRQTPVVQRRRRHGVTQVDADAAVLVQRIGHVCPQSLADPLVVVLGARQHLALTDAQLLVGDAMDGPEPPLTL